MRTIEEISSDLLFKTYTIEEFIDKIDELVETVATLQREKCAEEAMIIKLSNSYGVDWGTPGILSNPEIGKVFTKPDEQEDEYKFEINRESILNAKL
jgi:hypothetical protein